MFFAKTDRSQNVAEDLQHKSMGIAECEKKIKALADEIHKKNKSNRVGVDFFAAEDAIRKFYGLPERVPMGQAVPTGEQVAAAILDLDALMGL